MYVVRKTNFAYINVPNIKQAFYRLFIISLYALLSACASLSSQPPESDILESEQRNVITSPLVSKTELGWWQVGFHRYMDEDEEPAWYMDTLVAYEIIKPVLEQYGQHIRLWRFHRRAAVDKSGHKFSFIFYSERRNGELIYKVIEEDEITKSLQKASYINWLSFVDINGKARAEIEATSDKNWPIELQKAWPEFAMGVSNTWLRLSEQYVEQSNKEQGQNVAGLVEEYKLVSDDIDSVWQQNGGHAFLHHLNALFGYQELYIIERKLTRF